MKFGKSLSSQIEDALPEWKDKFLSYKHLKKRLKLVRSAASPPAKRPRVDKFNAFFLEKDEEYIICQKELQDHVKTAIAEDSKVESMRVRKEIVDFHGEMVLLENYSALNYTGMLCAVSFMQY